MIDLRTILEILIMLGGLISVYVGINTRLARVEQDLKWIKNLLLNNKE